MTTVLIWEMDSWSGRKLDEIKEFDTLSQAEAFIAEFNAQNTSNTVPDWYMYAELDD